MLPESAGKKLHWGRNDYGLGKISLDYRLFVTDMKLLGMDMSVEGEHRSLSSILSTKASADLYNFNLIADEILNTLYGLNSRKS